jgi:hypothetical protein
MPTLRELLQTGVADVRNHYHQVLTGQNAPMISPENSPPAEEPYGGMSHSEKDMISAPSGEAAPTGMDGEALAPEQTPPGWSTAFARLASHHVMDADYTDISGQKQLTGPQPGSSSPEQEHPDNAPEL